MDKAGTRPYTPYLIKELTNGLKLPLIGITTPDSAILQHPKNSVNVNFVDPVMQQKKYCKKLDKDIQMLILQSH
ncbi:bifunctional 2',3'-cyclic nucleotide 2'-phosphodiesterase/3'-nucleotidase precursor protein [Mycoplasmopsis caviae]|uniref:Bifunctional 2',3'-cyclic nucleotide 2'-phosphodiesterase/3'-nucleotidase protein n=2 Tax=Mycoplasmopsis caviae TaxID=55603 RepID=A0A3P8KDJ8_9BACT|nr:bifunctional 2',3'-cyclic nucleotide 2'-phosphodiesterase/3'-nucleotidase precursor protein [Mycoplasmopsis caviae]